MRSDESLRHFHPLEHMANHKYMQRIRHAGGSISQPQICLLAGLNN